ncbi:MAG: dihydroorotate dehydrogenase [Theionarchaea archaeon]|nr:dihydroorotate dehydrogenase [Theionarchaea archaeon]MBU7038494.1 dihydroorotate dehydrogenase [Theionarchaea archaeon]
MDISTSLCGIPLRNPLILASGILGNKGALLRRVAESGAGAVATKSVGPEPREGYNNPTVLYVSEDIVLNAMGLPNPGCEQFAGEIETAKTSGIPVIASVFGRSQEEFSLVAMAMEEAGADIVELNVSCPHSLPRLKGLHLGQIPVETKGVVKRVKQATTVPVLVKLSPNVTSIVEVARACIEGGADGLSLINTVQALEIDPLTERPMLGNMVGGQSGPSIRCIAQRKVADVLTAMRRGELEAVPVVGAGGIESGEDVARYILLGCQCVQIGSAVLKYGLDAFSKCLKELEGYMKEKGYETLEDFRGKSLEWLV